MKKRLYLILSMLLLLLLTACSKKEDVDYYVTKQYVEFSTGDINLRTYTYDDQWHILSSQILLNGEFASSVEYIYNEAFTEMTMVTASAIYDSETTKVSYRYDDAGNMTQAVTCFEDGTPAYTTDYFYDQEGRQVKTESVIHETNMHSTTERVFDSKGNLVTYLHDNGYYATRLEYTYDAQNRRLSRHDYQGDDLTSYIEYVWEGNIQTGTVYHADGTPARKTVSRYDDAGNLLTEDAYDLLDTLQSRTYYEYIGTDGSISGGIPE